LYEELQALEAKRAETEAEVKARDANIAELTEKHHAAVETHERQRFTLEETKSRLEREKSQLEDDENP